MMNLHAKQALLPTGWASDVAIEIAKDGRIAAISPNSAAAKGAEQVELVLPAPVNVHSHAFQRAMAGMTERRGPDPRDTFWTWRALMYKFLNRLTPEHVEAITAFVQMEMLEAGFAANVEFHYLHHQPDGSPYDKLSEMSERVAAASAQTGIGLTLLPVLYQYGGCDQRPLGAGQVRFGNELARFTKLHEEAAGLLNHLPRDAALGMAPHSLRAVAPADLRAIADCGKGQPIHLHLAEQIAEVEEVSSAWGKRPVEWVLDELEITPDWCFIHCTQMLPHETRALARTGAVAGLCPMTEFNLGDGIFDAVGWLENNGQIAIGSDSNIRISLSEELRLLDYSQRLRDRSRAALATVEHSVGRRLYEAICKGGAQAAGRETGTLEKGAWADLLCLDMTSPILAGQTGDTLLDCFIFAGDDSLVTDVWSAGRHQVQHGRHRDREKIEARYIAVMKMLTEAL